MCFWRCPKDEIEFEDLPSYEEHVSIQHPSDMDKLLSDGVLTTQRFLAERQNRPCPFCDVDLHGVGEMSDHIGSHLETVALLAIPTLIHHGLQPKSDVASSKAAREDADGSRKNDFDKTLPVGFLEIVHMSEHSSAQQKLSGPVFLAHLAELPGQAQNCYSLQVDVARNGFGDSMPDHSGPAGASASPLSQDFAHTSGAQQRRKLSGHWQVAKLPCFMMGAHTRDENFFGREKILQALDEVLLPSTRNGRSDPEEAAKHAVLFGMGGIGKTSIAIEFAFSQRDHFDAVFWIRADKNAKLQQDFIEIAINLGLADPLGSHHPLVLREFVKGWLGYPKRVLDQDTDTTVQGNAQLVTRF